MSKDNIHPCAYTLVHQVSVFGLMSMHKWWWKNVTECDNILKSLWFWLPFIFLLFCSECHLVSGLRASTLGSPRGQDPSDLWSSNSPMKSSYKEPVMYLGMLEPFGIRCLLVINQTWSKCSHRESLAIRVQRRKSCPSWRIREFIYRRLLSRGRKKSDNTENSWHENKCPPIPQLDHLKQPSIYRRQKAQTARSSQGGGKWIAATRRNEWEEGIGSDKWD